MPRPKSNPAKATKATGRNPRAKPTAKDVKSQLAEKAPLGSLPAESGQSAATSELAYSIGNGVFWASPSTAGEWTFIGHPRDDKAGKVLVMSAHHRADEATPGFRARLAAWKP